MFPPDPFKGPLPKQRFRNLEDGVTVHDVADRCREAGLEYFSGANGAWSSRDLAKWLMGSYRAATAPPSTVDSPFRKKATPPLHLDEGAVIGLLVRTRECVLEMILSPRSAWEEGGLGAEMLARGLLLGVRDGLGSIGYAPIDLPDTRLVDRVASLFVADYLTRPGDYEEIQVCDECGEISFRWQRRHRERCAVTTSQSGVVPKREADAPPRKNTRLGLGG